MAGRAAVTRERYIDLVTSFLKWCQRRPRQWIGALPIFERDREARYRKERRARRVGDLRPELIALLIGNAPRHLKGQLAIMWSTGARVSSIIYFMAAGCAIIWPARAANRSPFTIPKTVAGSPPLCIRGQLR